MLKNLDAHFDARTRGVGVNLIFERSPLSPASRKRMQDIAEETGKSSFGSASMMRSTSADMRARTIFSSQAMGQYHGRHQKVGTDAIVMPHEAEDGLIARVKDGMAQSEMQFQWQRRTFSGGFVQQPKRNSGGGLVGHAKLFAEKMREEIKAKMEPENENTDKQSIVEEAEAGMDSIIHMNFTDLQKCQLRAGPVPRYEKSAEDAHLSYAGVLKGKDYKQFPFRMDKINEARARYHDRTMFARDPRPCSKSRFGDKYGSNPMLRRTMKTEVAQRLYEVEDRLNRRNEEDVILGLFKDGEGQQASSNTGLTVTGTAAARKANSVQIEDEHSSSTKANAAKGTTSLVQPPWALFDTDKAAGLVQQKRAATSTSAQDNILTSNMSVDEPLTTLSNAKGTTTAHRRPRYSRVPIECGAWNEVVARMERSRAMKMERERRDPWCRNQVLEKSFNHSNYQRKLWDKHVEEDNRRCAAERKMRMTF
ncbi:unnamed protein product [Amoebophrya sp. A25]|nr:unnamed protein product [Amoebophrya sp. A25]|eukprot:GSA25T00011992001.1